MIQIRKTQFTPAIGSEQYKRGIYKNETFKGK